MAVIRPDAKSIDLIKTLVPFCRTRFAEVVLRGGTPSQAIFEIRKEPWARAARIVIAEMGHGSQGAIIEKATRDLERKLSGSFRLNTKLSMPRGADVPDYYEDMVLALRRDDGTNPALEALWQHLTSY
jgi:hypothetical protein